MSALDDWKVDSNLLQFTPQDIIEMLDEGVSLLARLETAEQRGKELDEIIIALSENGIHKNEEPEEEGWYYITDGGEVPADTISEALQEYLKLFDNETSDMVIKLVGREQEQRERAYAAEKARDEARRIIKELEFCGGGMDDYSTCPICGSISDNAHLPTCELAAWLAANPEVKE